MKHVRKSCACWLFSCALVGEFSGVAQSRAEDGESPVLITLVARGEV